MQKIKLNYKGTYIQTCRGMIKLVLLIVILFSGYLFFEESWEIALVTALSGLVSFWYTMLLTKSAEGILILRTKAEGEMAEKGQVFELQE